jgi:PTH1 family peptidyl-tRNA hydrolase
MLLVVGLGNPGEEHARNRHNIGFMAVDAIADRHGFPSFRAKFHGRVAEKEVAGRRIALLKPMTYMNDSGRSVQAALAFHRLPPASVLVFHDELDLAPGKVRVKRGGGHAGHNGLRSLHAHLGPDYARVRLGIGRPAEKERGLGYVLGDFAKADRAWLERLLEALGDHFPLLIRGEDGAFMSKVALAVSPPPPRKPTPAAPGAAPE